MSAELVSIEPTKCGSEKLERQANEKVVKQINHCFSRKNLFEKFSNFEEFKLRFSCHSPHPGSS